MKQIILALIAILLSSCASHVLTGGGRAGAVVNDALPENATVYRAEIGESSDASDSASLVWNPLHQEIPCSVIRGVEYYRSGVDAGEFSLRLIGHKYGGRYYPMPPASGSWRSPMLWVDADRGLERNADFKESDAAYVASHCGVDFHARN